MGTPRAKRRQQSNHDAKSNVATDIQSADTLGVINSTRYDSVRDDVRPQIPRTEVTEASSIANQTLYVPKCKLSVSLDTSTDCSRPKENDMLCSVSACTEADLGLNFARTRIMSTDQD